MSNRVETASAIGPSLAEEWEELASRHSAPPFLRPGWFDAWSRAFGRSEPLVLLARRGGRLAGVLALEYRRSALVSTSNWHTPAFSALAEDDRAVAELIDAALARTKVRLDLFPLDEESPVLEACRRAANSTQSRLIERTMQESPYLRIEGDWDTYEKSLPSRRTSKYRRVRRRLDEHGEVSFLASDGSEGLAERLREGFEVEAAGFERAGVHGSSIRTEAGARQFYTEVAEWAASRGWLRLWTLRVGGEPIAFAYGLEHDGVYYDMKVGFDPRYAKFGPGVLLMREQIHWAFDAHLERFEFLGGADRHKLAWTETLRPRRRIQAFPPTARGALDHLAWERGRPLAKRLRHAAGRVRGAGTHPSSAGAG